MDKVKEMVTNYARANGYEIRHDFAQHTRTFSKDETTLREDDIKGSQGFAGFCDGYQNRPHRYKSPTGTPERSLAESGAASLNITIRTTAEQLLSDRIPAAEINSVLEYVTGEPEYDKQYKLGRSCSK